MMYVYDQSTELQKTEFSQFDTLLNKTMEYSIHMQWPNNNRN